MIGNSDVPFTENRRVTITLEDMMEAWEHAAEAEAYIATTA